MILPTIPALVSTIIPVYNRPHMLRKSVQSVLDQTYQPIEVIIADDGSTDATPEVGRQLESHHPGVVRFFRSELNSGSGPGPMRELGRQHARGEFIQYLDSDDRLLPDKFRDQVSALTANPDCDIAYGMTRLVDETGAVLADPFKWTARRIPQIFPGLLVDRWWCTHTPLYRRTLTDRIGPWSNLRWSQDWEYDARAGALGAKLVHCGTLVSEHVHHSGERQTSSANWGTDPVRLRNRHELLVALWAAACRSRLPSDCPERQHFARWCFRIARQCDGVGLPSEGSRLFQIASDASEGGPGSRGLEVYRLLKRIFGSRILGKTCTLLEAVKTTSSAATLPQSFSVTSKAPQRTE